MERDVRGELAERIEALTNYRLHDFQRRAIEAIDRTDKNILVVAPTGAGKSVIGFAALLKHRGFYLAPLIALMQEKYADIRGLARALNYSVVVTNRDFRLPFRVIKEADIRIMSPYKFLAYLNSFSDDELRGQAVVVDEIHLMSHDPLFEAAVTLAKRRGVRIIGLSATVADEDRERLARWLDAELIVESQRPVELKHLALVGLRTHYGFEVQGMTQAPGVPQVLRQGEVFGDRFTAAAALAARLWTTTRRPVIVWAPTRKLVARLATAIAAQIGTEQPQFVPLASKVPGTGGFDATLRGTVKYGVWIHHGGMSYSTREFVLEHYKRLGGVIVTSYTLSHGVNIPGTFLIIPTIYDYKKDPIDASFFHQISGRAGRPGYDTVGYVITVIEGYSEAVHYKGLLSQGASKIEPTLLSNPFSAVKFGLTVYSRTRDLREVEDVLRDTYHYFTGGVDEQQFSNIMSEVKEAVDFYSNIKDRSALVAMDMGIHPLEYQVLQSALSNNSYEEFVRFAATTVAERILGVSSGDVVSDVIKYGYLATLVGRSPASRDVADYIQNIIETGSFWAWRSFGFKSPEHQRLLDLAKRFAYANNPNVEPLASAVQIHVLRRMIKAVNEIVTGLGSDDPEKAVALTGVAVKEAYIFNKRVSRKKVARLAGLVFKAITGRDPQPDELNMSVAKAIEELKSANKDLQVTA